MRSFFVNIPLSPLKVRHTPSEQMRHRTNTRTQRNKHNTTPNTRTEVPPLKGLNKCLFLHLPRACALGCAGVSPLWGSLPDRNNQSLNNPPQYHKQHNHNQTNTKTRTNPTSHLHTQTHLTNTTPQTPNTTKSPARAIHLQSPG